MSINKQRRWSFKGLKQYFPDLDMEQWLKYCSQGRQFNKNLPLEIGKNRFIE